MARKPKANGKPSDVPVTTTRRKRVTVGNPFEEAVAPKEATRYVAAQKATHVQQINLEAKTEPQRQMIEAYAAGLNIFAVGSAGTGKTFLALALGLQDLMAGRIKKIIIVRSAVQVRDLGHLPGNLTEKMAEYALPYKCLVNEIMHNDSMWDILTKKNLIVFMSTSFIRGITLDESLVILDESQNLDFEEGNSVCTRLGIGSRLIVCGDTKQSDLQRHREKSGLTKLVSVAEKLPKYFEIINFLPQDIVRSALVKAWIIAEEQVD